MIDNQKLRRQQQLAEWDQDQRDRRRLEREEEIHQPKWSLSVAVDHGFVWALLAAPASLLGFLLVVCVCALTPDFGSEIGPVLLFNLAWASETLVEKSILHPENLPGALMVGHVVPWMLIGYLFGFFRGWRITSRTALNGRGFRIFSLLADIALVLTALLVFWF